jgi:hypothetical protein
VVLATALDTDGPCDVVDEEVVVGPLLPQAINRNVAKMTEKDRCMAVSLSMILS